MVQEPPQRSRRFIPRAIAYGDIDPFMSTWSLTDSRPTVIAEGGAIRAGQENRNRPVIAAALARLHDRIGDPAWDFDLLVRLPCSRSQGCGSRSCLAGRDQSRPAGRTREVRGAELGSGQPEDRARGAARPRLDVARHETHVRAEGRR